MRYNVGSYAHPPRMRPRHPSRKKVYPKVFLPGETVRITTPQAPDSPFNGAEGTVMRQEVHDCFWVWVPGLGEFLAHQKNLTRLADASSPDVSPEGSSTGGRV